jgi:tRNA modification GTPase
VEPLRELLEEWIARGEAAVEFVDESETHLPGGTMRQAIERARASCAELLRGFRTGRIVRDGAALAVVGLPNAGKSSLFNRLLERERAIVTDLSGIPVTLIDTAGLREAHDPAESEGVRRARLAREEADLVLLVLDGSRPLEPEECEALERAAGESEQARTVVVLNKCDLPQAVEERPRNALPVSALTGEGLGPLREELHTRLVGAGPVEDPVVTDARHADALSRTDAALERAARAADEGLSEELLLEDLKLAMRHLGEIVGEMGNEELYDRIFSTFCIGK